MTRNSSALQLLALIGVLGFVVVIACENPDSIDQPGQNGGKKHNPYSCVIGPAQNGYGQAYSSARVSGAFTQGLQDRPTGFGCPYVVDHTQDDIAIGVQLAAYYANIHYAEPAEFSGLTSKWFLTQTAAPNTQYWTDDQNVTDGKKVEFAEPYEAALLDVTSQTGHDFAYDSGGVSFSSSYGAAEARIVITGGVNYHTITPDLVVPYLTTLTPANIRAEPEVDTNSYGWAWVVDGNRIEHNDAQYPAQLLPGSHTVMALAQLGDLTVDTIVATVYSEFQVGILGQTAPDPSTPTTYQAYIPVGYSPYTYDWQLDGVDVGSSDEVTLSFGPNETHYLYLSVRDSHGFGTGVQITITSNGGCCGTRRVKSTSAKP